MNCCAAPLLDAAQALALGLIDAAAPADGDQVAFVAEHVGRFAMQKPQVVRAFKALAIMHRFSAGAAETAEAEGAHFARAWEHPDHWAAVTAMGR